jgi:hypothetical protein
LRPRGIGARGNRWRHGVLLQATFHDRITALRDRAEELATGINSATALVAWLRELVSHAAATRGLTATLMEVPGTGR